jgi:pimeloyl-ACP methyl ester carboxylesterase
VPVSDSFVQCTGVTIGVSQSEGTGLPVLLIHGNSSCKEVFHDLINEFGNKYHLIGLDLPGHGASSDAILPEQTYTLPGYAAVAIELLTALGIREAIVYGWSLGGCIGLEMVAHFPGLIGLMISGAPPASPTTESLRAAYRLNPEIGSVTTADPTRIFTASASTGAFNDGLRQAARRADKRARAIMISGMLSGKFADQHQIIETARFPIAVVDGAADPFINIDYVANLRFASLWDEHYYLLRGVGHVPFLEAPKVFYPIFERFLADMDKRAATVRGSGSASAAA